MKSLYARSLWAACGLMGLAQPIMAAEPFGSASLLPMPSLQVPASPMSAPRIVQTGYGSFQEEIPSVSDKAPPPPQPPAEVPPFSAPPAGLSPDYESAMKQSWNGAGCAGPNCSEAAGVSGGGSCSQFYVYGGGLVLGRANQCNDAISQQVGTYETVLGTGRAEQDWSGGVEGKIGWVMPNYCNAIELGYWGIYPDNQSASIHAPDYAGGVRPIIGANLDQLYYDDGMTNQSVQAWMTTTNGVHEISRSFAFHNVEANFLGNAQAWGVTPGGGDCGSCFDYGWLAGFRYFQFNEGFDLRTEYDDWMIGDAGDYDELRYHIGTTNTLLGFQLGGQGMWHINNCFSLYGGGRAGVFNNHVESGQYINGLGGDAMIATGTYAGQAYRYESDRDALAGIGQIDLGMRYQHGCHWSFMGGYRVVGIAGVATASSQMADNFADPRYVNTICVDDSVILHGAYAGAQYTW